MRAVHAVRVDHGPHAIFYRENESMTRAIEFSVYFVGRVGTVPIAGLVPMEVDEVVKVASNVSVVLFRRLSVLFRRFLACYAPRL